MRYDDATVGYTSHEVKGSLWRAHNSLRYKYFRSEGTEQRRRVLAQWLSEAMKRVGVTQAQLSSRTGVARPTISKLLNAKADGGDATLEKLAKALHAELPQAPSGVAEPRALYGTNAEGLGEPGWMFGDPSEAEEQFRTYIRNIERTHRMMVADPNAFPADGIRRVQLDAVRLAMDQCELGGRPVPEFLHRVRNELIQGTFR